MILKGEQLTLNVGKKCLIDNIDINIPENSFSVIIGPNGAGKTTLLKMLDGDVRPTGGQLSFYGKTFADIGHVAMAKRRAVLPQLSSVPFSIKARDIVSLGREPYRYDDARKHNKAVIQASLEKMAVTEIAENDYTILSGGEQCRVQLARTLAQICTTADKDMDLSGKILFLDEPTNHLDIHHQYHLMQTLKNLQKRGLTIVAVMHDLSLSLQFSNHIFLLEKGKKVGEYTPDELVESDDLSKVYNMKMTANWDSTSRRYLLSPELTTI